MNKIHDQQFDQYYKKNRKYNMPKLRIYDFKVQMIAKGTFLNKVKYKHLLWLSVVLKIELCRYNIIKL